MSVARQSQNTALPIRRNGMEAIFASEKAMARGMAEHWSQSERLPRARIFCAELVKAYHYQQWLQNGKKGFGLSEPPSEEVSLNDGELTLAHELGRQLSQFTQAEVCYLIGTVYTVLLPPEVRARLGAYYTPPCLVDRLLDRITDSGFDWKTGTVLDPACGGGAFLAPLAIRMAAAMSDSDPEFVLASLAHRLSGYEIDPFAAWVSQSLLEICLLPVSSRASRRVPKLVSVLDSLSDDPGKLFDLVIGNPPYGRVSLKKSQRQRYARSLYGHANLYGLFTDLGLRLTRQGGVLAYVTPTSFLGGQYFKSLRRLILEEAAPVVFEFVADREGVFDGALQETLLAVYKKGGSSDCKAALLKPYGLSELESTDLGNVVLPEQGENAWVLQRHPAQRAMVARLTRMPTRLCDIGYGISTGPLVWNRHKTQLRHSTHKGAEIYPLIWAEAIKNNEFSLSYSRAHHLPFIQVNKNQAWLITQRVSILCQRTTSKEQERRLVTALLPFDLVREYGGVVVENHLNLIVPTEQAGISPLTLVTLLNSEAADKAFRCISGSVAVSAFELNSLPIPQIDQLLELEGLVRGRASTSTIEATINEFYGL